MAIRSHLESYLEESVAGLRHESMNLYARQLMISLRRGNYHLDDLLDGLANYADERFGSESLVKLLEDASQQAKELRRQSHQ